MKIAVLGLGRMGAALASRLTAHELTVWNRSAGHADELVRQGAAEAGSAAEAAAGAELVLTSLSGDDAVRAVLLPDGAPLDTGATVIDCSTVSPQLSADLAAAYPGRFVAGPIAGAPPALRDGKATWIVAGPRGVLDELAPVLDAVTTTRLDAGEQPERAARVKLLNNYLLLGGLAVLADAVVAGQQAGFADEELTELLTALPVVSPGVAVRLPKLLDDDHDPAFTVALGRKDLGLFRDVFGSTPLSECVDATYADAGADLDVSAVVDPIRKARRAR